jgi:hypothetical protein
MCSCKLRLENWLLARTGWLLARTGWLLARTGWLPLLLHCQSGLLFRTWY